MGGGMMTESALMDTPLSSRRSVVEVVTRGERRRRWSEEDCARILTEAMAPCAIASHVARHFGVSSGQFYTWRKAMLSRAMPCGCKSELAKADFVEARLSAPDPKWPSPQFDRTRGVTQRA